MPEENKTIEGVDSDTATLLMGGSPQSTSSNQSDTTNLDKSSTSGGKADAPASGQDDTGKQADKKDNQPPPQGQEDGKKAEEMISDDDLKKHLGLSETPEHKAERLDREYAASSKESRRLTEANKKISELLKEQGLELAIENGVPVGLMPGKNYSKNATDFDLKLKDLSEDERALFETDPQKAVDLVIARAQKAFVRAMPTIDRMIQPVSPEREEVALNHLKSETWESGDKKYPDFDKNIGLVKQIIGAPNISKALKDFYNQEPEMATEYLLHRITAARNYVLDQARKIKETREQKEKEARQTPPLGPNSGGTPTIGENTEDIGDQIAKAGLRY
ncbi:MAG: hypothetical protein WC451_05225 [Patescibacteria group bacterium]